MLMLQDQNKELRGMTIDEIEDLLILHEEKAFRGRQVFDWIQSKAVQAFHEMKNLGPLTKEKLKKHTELIPLNLMRERVSIDGTRKYLWGLKDGLAVESVLLFHSGDLTKTRNTICLSTQAGCPMGCTFCATGKMGFQRNLTVAEIISQVLDITYIRRKEEPNFKINNLVYMGMGEPLLNLPAVIKSIKILNHEDGQNIGIRRITISTSGLVPQIRELAGEDLDIVLAVSLHAPNNELRNSIMPVNKRYPLEELIGACIYYTQKTGRRITFEYALVKGFNDSTYHARQLADLIGMIPCNVNIIPINKVEGIPEFDQPQKKDVKSFVRTLKGFGINTVVREEKGSDIEAACGQLAGDYYSPVAPYRR